MIEEVIERWHQNLRGELAGGLASLLHDDVVFYSPVVFTPQRGKEITMMYLAAAANTLPGDKADGDGSADGGGKGAFGYVNEIMSDNVAMLEFETEMNGKYVNGIDLITCNDEGLIIEFKVMIRPLQAVNELHAQMKAMLEQLSK